MDNNPPTVRPFTFADALQFVAKSVEHFAYITQEKGDMVYIPNSTPKSVGITSIVKNFAHTENDWMKTVPNASVTTLVETGTLRDALPDYERLDECKKKAHDTSLSVLSLLQQCGTLAVLAVEFKCGTAKFRAPLARDSADICIPVGSIDVLAWDHKECALVIIDWKTTAAGGSDLYTATMKRAHVIRMHYYGVLLSKMAADMGMAHAPRISHIIIMAHHLSQRKMAAWRIAYAPEQWLTRGWESAPARDAVLTKKDLPPPLVVLP